MIQTKKNYKLQGNSFVEDLNGFIIGYEWTDDNSILRRCLYIESTDDLINRTTSAKCRYEMYDPEYNEWVLRDTKTFLATMDSYVYNDGSLEPNIYEDDLTSPIYSGVDEFDNPIIVGYEKKLKDNLIPEFYFFYYAQLPLFDGVMQSLQARKFGATGFI